jgi:hypothetical protein
MAVITLTKLDTGPDFKVYQWTPLTEADTCAAIKLDRVAADIMLQVTGTFGSASVALHGSLDGTNYVALKDADGAAIAVTSAGLTSARDAPLWLKPVASGGSSQSLTIALLVRTIAPR